MSTQKNEAQEEEKKKRRYYEGEVKWKSIDSILYDHLKGSSSQQFVEQYAANLKGKLPSVPETFPYTEINKHTDPYNGDLTRITARTYILKPSNWVIRVDNEGPQTGGHAFTKAEHTFTESTKVAYKIHGEVELSSNAGVSGSWGPFSMSAELKSKVGAEWTKEVTSETKTEGVVDDTKPHQMIKMRAKLKCSFDSGYVSSFTMIGEPFGYGGGIALNKEGVAMVNPSDFIENKTTEDAKKPISEVIQAANNFAKEVAFHGPLHTTYPPSMPGIEKINSRTYATAKIIPEYETGQALVTYGLSTASEAYYHGLYVGDGHNDYRSPVYYRLDGSRIENGDLEIDYQLGKQIEPALRLIELPATKGSK